MNSAHVDNRKNWHHTDDIHAPQGKGDPFAAAMRSTRMPMLITDPNQPDNPIVFVNDAFLSLTGYDREDIIGKNCRFLQGSETSSKSVENIRSSIAANRDVAVEILNYRKDGTTFWNALFISPVIDEGGKLLYFFASQLDVTDKKTCGNRAEFTARPVRNRGEGANTRTRNRAAHTDNVAS